MENGPVNWAEIALVIFDMDGTLYDQKALRLRMARELALHTLRTRSLKTLRILKAYRCHRETLAEQQAENFHTRQFDDVANSLGHSVQDIQACVMEWMEQRPLPHLMRCRRPGVAEVFKALQCAHRQTAIWSDYAVDAKLAALGLRADVTVTSEDDGVMRLKPNPAGLHAIMRRAKLPPDRCLMIGDRFDRDWAAAQQAGVRALIFSTHTQPGCDSFTDFRGEPFAALVRGGRGSSFAAAS
jgi:phosphoglycolate phosphatase/putative hydrolase of the HAD superfamily